MAYQIERITGKDIETLFKEYKHLASRTAYKYFSNFMQSAWKEDILAAAELGIYTGLQRIESDKIESDLSIESFLVFNARTEAKNLIRTVFGYEGTSQREGHFNTGSYNQTINNDGKSNEIESTLSEDNLLANNSISEEQRIQYMDLYAAIDKLDERDKAIVMGLLQEKTLASIGEELGMTKDMVFRAKKRIFKILKEELEVVA